MAYSGLREFISFLESKGELARISVEVDPILEITEIADRVMKEGGPALLFEHVRGSAWPLLINAYGSEKRMAWSLGAESLDDKANEIESLIGWAWSQLRDFSLLSTIPEALPKLPIARSLMPKRCGAHPAAPLWTKGASTASPSFSAGRRTAGAFSPCLSSVRSDPRQGPRTGGMYRMQVYDDRTAGMHWHIHKDGAHFFQKYQAQRRRMPVVVALGGDPAVTYAATAPLPEGIWEAMFAGFLRGRAADVVEIGDTGILAPADAEFILEGYVDPEELRLEGHSETTPASIPCPTSTRFFISSA